MNTTRSNAERALVGNDHAVSLRWSKLALGSLVIACVGFAAGQVLSITAPANPSGVLETAHGYVGVLLLFVALVAVVAGLLAGVIHAYLNDGVLVSIALALAPVAGLAVGYLISDQILFTVARREWASMEGGLYVFVVGGFFVLVLGVVGFAVGAGGRRARAFLARQ